MIHYLIRRSLIAVVTLFLITFLVYGLIRFMPGDPVSADPAMMDPSKMMDKDVFDAIKKQYGLDKPWYQAYFSWVTDVATLDFGESFAKKRPVIDIIVERMPATLLLTVTSLLLSYAISIPLGLYVTVKSGTVVERTISTLLYMLYSLPAFVAALFLQIFLAVKMKWLPLDQMHSNGYENFTVWENVWDIAKHSLMPVICFTYGSLAYYSRFIKANMEEVIRQDYIRTAKAKGVPPRQIVFHHAFRNTMIPMVTMIGLTLPSLLSGAVILEQIFTWPGMGRLYFESIGLRDYPTIMGLTLMFAVLTLAGQLLADILYAVVDPRVSYT